MPRGGRILALLVLLTVLVWSGRAAAQQEKRYALLIGNQAYDASVGVLKNPHNDIEIVAKSLKGQGFEVLPLVKDARRSTILGAVRDLANRLRVAGPGAVGFFYYSGHGAAEKDTNINYLIPVDAKDPGSTAFWDDSLKLDDIMRLLDQARGAVKFVVFDACRNELQLPTRDTTKGLVPVAEQQGFFVAYASAPGRTASDRGERSGPYAAALSREFARPGLDHLNLFQNVKETVIASTGGAQHPWESNGLTRRVYLTGEPTMPADIALWESVRTTGDIPSLQRYLDRFPKGVFAATARQMIERLEAESAQKQAALQFEIERKAQDAKQQAELQKALDEARKAREALATVEAQRASAERAAAEARAAVAAAIAERDQSARREGELRKAQDELRQAAAVSGQSAAERSAALAELERRLATAAEEARASRQALATAEARQHAAEKAATEARTAAADRQASVAALPPPPSPTAVSQALRTEELASRLQSELKRVGCYPGDVDGEWGAGSRNALEAFVKTTGFLFDSAEPSAAALDAVASQRVRICPLRCAAGEVERGGRCVAAAPPNVPVPKTAKTRAVALGDEPKKRSSQANRPDPSRYSLSIWPPGSLRLGQTVSSNTPFGRLTCTSAGPAGGGSKSRPCRWN